MLVNFEILHNYLSSIQLIPTLDPTMLPENPQCSALPSLSQSCIMPGILPHQLRVLELEVIRNWK